MRNQEFSSEVNAIERILESAVTLNWEDFTTRFIPVAMQIEYRSGPDCWLEYLKVWSSASRGHWNLVCEYRVHATAAHLQGVTFNDSYSSAGLTRMLDAIMHNQQAFAVASSNSGNGLVHIVPPNDTQSIAAKHLMMEMLERITSRASTGAVTGALRCAADHPRLSDQTYAGVLSPE